MLLSVHNHLWELLTEGKKERLFIMLNPSWKSSKGGESTDLWPWGAFRAPYHAPGNILSQISKALTCPGMGTWQGQRQPVVCVQQLFLGDSIKWPESQKGLSPTSYSTRQRMRAENISYATSPTLWRRLGLSQVLVLSQSIKRNQEFLIYRSGMVRPTGQPLELATLPLIFSGIYLWAAK